MAKQELTYAEVLNGIKNKQYKPVYYLMGEEAYYIDLIANYIAENVLSETEKEFNQTIVYGADTDMDRIITAARRYPMMAEHQVIIVKEAQALKNIDELSVYLKKPLLSTILVFCHKHGTLDKRKKVTLDIEKNGILFDSKKLKESQIPPFIHAYLSKKGVSADAKSIAMLADFVGTDLNKLVGEMEKLIITLPAGQKSVTPEQIEKNIGISKDYNNYELLNALINKDVFKANQIVAYLNKSNKANALPGILAFLFNFYSNLMLAYYAPEKSESGIAAQLDLRSSWQSRDYIRAMQKYTAVKVMHIIEDIRYCDAKAKGVDNPSVGSGELLRELLFRILH